MYDDVTLGHVERCGGFEATGRLRAQRKRQAHAAATRSAALAQIQDIERGFLAAAQVCQSK
jgi:hypothetical protein